MTQDNQTNVINFEKKGRRKAIAKLTKNYAAMLAHIMQQSVLDDGEHYDDDGLPIVRSLDRSEMRHGAVVTAAQMFCGMLAVRSGFEQQRATDDGLHDFQRNAEMRMKNYSREHLGRYKIMIKGKYRRDLQRIEQNYVSDIFTALRIEAKNDPDFSEADFWADIFRGFGDGDPTGVILRAAGLVLLDHLTHFHLALTAHIQEK